MCVSSTVAWVVFKPASWTRPALRTAAIGKLRTPGTQPTAFLCTLYVCHVCQDHGAPFSAAALAIHEGNLGSHGQRIAKFGTELRYVECHTIRCNTLRLLLPSSRQHRASDDLTRSCPLAVGF